MYVIIKKIFSYLLSLSNKKTAINTDQDISDIKSDINIKISADIETEQIFCKIDTDVEDILSNSSSISKCEKIAYFLSVICENNKYMTDLLLHNIEEQKQISEKHLLFYDNIVFFETISFSQKSINNYNTDPLIRPSKAFKIYAMEEKT